MAELVINGSPSMVDMVNNNLFVFGFSHLHSFVIVSINCRFVAYFLIMHLFIFSVVVFFNYLSQ